MSFYNLRKGVVYQWLAPSTARGLRFRVVDVGMRNNNVPGDKRYSEIRVYKIQYLNYPYRPAPLYLEISQSFIMANAHKLALVEER